MKPNNRIENDAYKATLRAAFSAPHLGRWAPSSSCSWSRVSIPARSDRAYPEITAGVVARRCGLWKKRVTEETGGVDRESAR